MHLQHLKLQDCHFLGGNFELKNIEKQRTLQTSEFLGILKMIRWFLLFVTDNRQNVTEKKLI